MCCDIIGMCVLSYICSSLVPSPSHGPVFDCLQYAKTEGEGLVHFITWMTLCLPRWTEGGRGTHFALAFFILNQERYIFHFVNVQNSSCWARNFKIRLQACFFNGGPLPHSDKMDEAFPLHFRILQAIKNWMVENSICCTSGDSGDSTVTWATIRASCYMTPLWLH